MATSVATKRPTMSAAQYLLSREKKHLKKIAKSVTTKVEKVGEKAKKNISKTNRDDGHLPNKFSLGEEQEGEGSKYDNSLNRFHDPLVKIKGGKRGSGRFLKNQDPGVNSDEEDGDGDDMFRFDALSHRSSGSSINIAGGDNLGTVSKTSTPLSGSLENIGGGELMRKSGGLGTPSTRRAFVPSESPLVSSSVTFGSLNVSNRESRPPSTEDMDEWEQKLLGKKGVPYASPARNRGEKTSIKDTSSQLSGVSLNSGNSNSQASTRNNTLERGPIPERPLSLPEQTPGGRKKKIIPVGSDFDSSPSPENSPGSPVSDRTSEADDDVGEIVKHYSGNFKLTSLPPTTTKSKPSGGAGGVADESTKVGKKMPLLLPSKWMNGMSIRDKDSKGGHKTSSESLGVLTHHRTNSDGGSSIGSPGNVPSGPRVVLGRETTPTSQHSDGKSIAIPKEVWDRFEGKSREGLIEMVVSLQDKVEVQARKQADLEEYIDVLLTKVLWKAPDLLQKSEHSEAQRRSQSVSMPSKHTSFFGKRFVFNK